MEERNVIAVVVTHNRLPLLQRCVDCLRANAPGRIIVVDNGYAFAKAHLPLPP